MKKILFKGIIVSLFVFAIVLLNNLNVYAAETVTITFNSNGGSAVESITLESGSEYYELAPVPTKENYAFSGWYTEETLENLFVFDGPITESKELYAKWLPSIESITITGLKMPVVGETAGDNLANVKAPSNANYEITSVKWMISTDGMYYTSTALNDYKFEEGLYFAYEIHLKAKEGYEFLFGDDSSFKGTLSISDLKANSAQSDSYGTLLIVGKVVYLLNEDNATYEVTEGANQTYTIGESTEARFTIDANQSVFDGNIVYIDGVEFDWEKYQYEMEGTSIILPKKYLDTLSVGSHTIKFEFLNDKTAETTFTIAEKTDEEETYDVIEGNDQTYTINNNTEAKFRIDADYSLFKDGGKVYVDDNLVDPKNYESQEGSTIIKLLQSYVDTLSEGSHEMKVVFNNSKVAQALFTVSKEKDDDTNTNTENNENTETNTSTNTEEKTETNTNTNTETNTSKDTSTKTNNVVNTNTKKTNTTKTVGITAPPTDINLEETKNSNDIPLLPLSLIIISGTALIILRKID